MSLSLKPNHATVKAYYETLHQFGQLHIDHEMAVRSAFQDLLATCGRRTEPKLTLIPEYRIKRARGSSVILDGALVDLYKLPHGYWEAKDEKDDLAKEVERKLDKGYPSDNTIFQAPERAILYQAGTRILDENITRPEALVDVVNQFFEYKAPNIQEWLKAIDEFSERVPELSQQVESLIKEERRKNPSFRNVFDDFYALCRQAINPNLSEEAVERMLIQHLLTERIFRSVFKDADFRTRNIVAAEIEKVIAELTKRSLNRDDFLKKLEPFYHAIERNAENATDYTAKQDFLNTVYMRFFQGYSPKEADTHGIVYTPQPIVNFMVRSVEEILQKEFGRSLSDKGVHILDPFVGTGNFITRIMQEINTTDVPYKYEHELHCNEVMLLPYYIASMNIEHAYYERVGEYKAFPGICLVDTFELAEPKQSELSFMTAVNAERVNRQKEAPIFVVIGNPPYNIGQVDENDRNKNRTYDKTDQSVDNRVRDTYAADSSATLRNSLRDPYVKAIRWATDRIGTEGIVAFVTNNGFLDGLAADGMRKHLLEDFDAIYVLNLKGNVRKNPKLSGSTHNVFGIQVGVSINFLVRNGKGKRPALVSYAQVGESWTRWQKYDFLDNAQAFSQVTCDRLKPSEADPWTDVEDGSGFASFAPLGSKNAKRGTEKAICTTYCNGAKSNSDCYVYNYSRTDLEQRARAMREEYQKELDRWRRAGRPEDIDNFLNVDESVLKWIRHTKRELLRGRDVQDTAAAVREGLYRPFSKQTYLFDGLFNEDLYQLPELFPAHADNILICVNMTAERPFAAVATDVIPNLVMAGGFGCTTQCFPFYTYAEDGTHRRENITDWALDQFRSHYADHSITKWDIFHYVYAILHHADYRQRYAANLRRELPRIPFVGDNEPTPSADNSPEGATDNSPGRKPGVDRKKENNSTLPKAVAGGQSPQATWAATNADIFRAFVKAGQRLAEIHVHYEQQPEYALKKIEKKGELLDYRVQKMKLSKDKTQLIYNRFLTLDGIPPETYEYRLGNRSALEWIIDQYQVSTDKRSGITNDPNRADDPTYILRLIGQVITVSLETVKIVKGLPELAIP
ncbi:MAG TPA: type ISP restriction/modification enzyme [Candidatus Sulfotelmatobacter sp.]|nr:type ISP restriction/modification enzyme [Candidatus Sulfotelmatobacter sp.]